MKLNQKCGVCHEALHKYKCPCCLILYCSTTCYKKHKTDTGSVCVKKDVSFSEKVVNEKTELALEDDEKLSLEKLELLSKSEDLKYILSNPHLQTMLNALDLAKNKQKFIEKCMQEPIFVEFADKCLSIVK